MDIFSEAYLPQLKLTPLKYVLCNYVNYNYRFNYKTKPMLQMCPLQWRLEQQNEEIKEKGGQKAHHGDTKSINQIS